MRRTLSCVALSCVSLAAALFLLGASAHALPLVAYDFNEGSGTTALNAGSLGAALNGTLNGPVYSSDTPSGSGTSIEFNGAGDYVRLVTTFSYGAALTVEAWIKADAVDGQRVLFDDYGNPGVLLAISDGALEFNVSTTTDPGPGVSIVGGTIPTGSWVHVAGVYDGSEVRTYIDTVWTGESAATSGTVIDDPITGSALGSDNISTDALNFDGKMDDFRIWDRALSPNQLAAALTLRRRARP